MSATTFLDFYKSDLQSVYLLCVVPLLFLAWLLFSGSTRAGAVDRATRFLFGYCVIFGVETILDPVATGPLTRWLGVGDSAAGTAILLSFVLLGDFRVYLLLFRLAAIDRPLTHAVRTAAAWTLLVPVTAYAADRTLHAAVEGLPTETIWLIYELAFLAVALWLRGSGIAARMTQPDRPLQARLESIAGYVAIYYALWATADVLTMVIGLDAGWALRVVPNQLYYAFFLPFVFARLSSRR